MKYVLIIGLLFCLFELTAQNYTSNDNDLLIKVQFDNEFSGHVSLFLDQGIEENYSKHLVSNSKAPVVLGYRIRIFSGSGHDAKKRAMTARARFYSKYPDVGAYLKYDVPDYKVYIGDCRTRTEVLKLFERIKKNFPNAFITPKQAIDLEKYKSSVNNE